MLQVQIISTIKPSSKVNLTEVPITREILLKCKKLSNLNEFKIFKKHKKKQILLPVSRIGLATINVRTESVCVVDHCHDVDWLTFYESSCNLGKGKQFRQGRQRQDK